MDEKKLKRFKRTAQVIAKAIKVFGDAELAVEWMTRQNLSLNNRAPFTLLDSKAGAQQDMQVLGKIEYGMCV